MDNGGGKLSAAERDRERVGRFGSSSGSDEASSKEEAPIGTQNIGNTGEGRTCLPCRKSKVKCDRKLPCARCTRLDIECTEQQVSKVRGRPLKLHKPRGTALALVQKAQPGVTDGAALAHLRASPQPNPFIFAEIMTTTFATLMQNGKTLAPKCTAALRLWERYNVVHNSDVTCGLLANVARLLLGHYELGVPSLNDLSPRSFLKSAVPMVAVDATWETPAALAELMDDSVIAYSGALFVQGEYRIVTNDVYSRVFMSIEECNTQLKDGHMLPTFVWASVLHENDHAAFFGKVAKMIFSADDLMGEITQTTRARDRHGMLHSCIVRQRYLYLTGGKDLVILFSLCPLNGSFIHPLAPQSAEDDDERDRLAFLLDNEPRAERMQLSQEPPFKRTAVQEESPSVPAPPAERRPRRAFQFPASDSSAPTPRATSATTTTTTTPLASDAPSCYATEPVGLAFPRAPTPAVALPPYPGAASLVPHLYPPVHSSAAYAVGTSPIPQVPAVWQQQAPPEQVALPTTDEALRGEELNYLLDVLAADSPPQRGATAGPAQTGSTGSTDTTGFIFPPQEHYPPPPPPGDWRP